MRHILLALVAFFPITSDAWAWGDEGHKVICEIALTCLVVKAVGENVPAAATDLMKTITAAKIEQWTHSDPMDWANESFAIAERAQTKYCVQHGPSCDLPDPAKVTIDAAYVQANTPIVREQLQKAGIRLAHALDAALAR